MGAFEIYLPQAGWVGTVFSRRFAGRIKTVTVRRLPSGKFFVTVLVEGESQVPDPVPETENRAVGVDLGLHAFVTLSTGEQFAHPQWLERELHRLKILQRRLARKAKGSCNRAKIRQQISGCMSRWRTDGRTSCTS